MFFDRNTRRTSLKHNLTQFEKKKSPRHCNTHKETRLLIGEYPEHFRKRGSMYSPGMDDVSSKEMNVLHVDVIELTLGNRSLCKQKLYQDNVCL